MFDKLLTSRRFWAFILAQVISIATAVVAHYVHDSFALQMAGQFITLVEGLAGFLILGYTIDDTVSHNQAIKMGVHPYYKKTE